MIEHNDRIYALRSAAAEVMAVEDVTEGVTSIYSRLLRRGSGDATQTDAVRIRGQLYLPPDQAYGRLQERFRSLGYTPLLRKDDNDVGEVILAIPGTLRQASQRAGVAAALFALTVVSCLFVGAQMIEGLADINWNLLDGVPYAASLLAILGAHELGHYVIARRVGTPVSLPYFLPVPIGFGTFGAFISMTAPPRNRRHLLAIAAAGPIAGLVLAIPLLWVGLNLSHVTSLPTSEYMLEGNSLLYGGLKYLAFGRVLPSATEDVFIHPVAFAGWAGLLVTGLNLIPAGQLDGGHIVYALVGERMARYVLWAVLAALAALAFLWQGWLLWLFLIFMFGRMRAAPLDDITQLTTRQRALAVAMVIIFFLVFTPIPLRIIVPS